MKFYQVAIMLLLLSAASSVLSQECKSIKDIKANNTSIKNIMALGKGYNIYYGNPLRRSDEDKGWKSNEIFNITSSDVAGDHQWQLPQEVRYSAQQSCSAQFTSSKLDSMEKYITSLSTSISGSSTFGIPTGAFSGSVDQQEQKEKIGTKNKLVIDSKAECIISDLALHDSPKLHAQLKPDFIVVLENLAKKNTKADFHSFFDNYGTHLSNSVKLGSRYMFTYELDEESVQYLEQTGINVEMGASGTSGELSASTSASQGTSNSFGSNTKNVQVNYKITTIGSKFPANMAGKSTSSIVAAWDSQTLNAPAPLYFSLIPYETVVTKFTKRSKGKLTDDDVKKLATGFETHLKTYCTEKLSKQGVQCTDATEKLPVKALGFIEKITKEGRPVFITTQFKKSAVAFTLKSNEAKVKMLEPIAFSGKQTQKFLLIKALSSGKDKSCYIKSDWDSTLCLKPIETDSKQDSKYSFVACIEKDKYQLFQFELSKGTTELFNIKNVGSNNYMQFDYEDDGNLIMFEEENTFVDNNDEEGSSLYRLTATY